MGKLTISRFAQVTWEGDRTCLYSPASLLYLRSRRPDLLRVLQAFQTPMRASDFLSKHSPSPESDAPWVEALLQMGALTSFEEQCRSLAKGPLRHWEPPDRVFHALSRNGARRAVPDAAGLRLPRFKPRARGRVIPLSSPAVPATSLWDALGRRRSTRRFSARPLDLEQVSALFAWAARSRGKGDRDRRPYPSGGGLYPLEIYALCPPGACRSLAAGLYHYRPREHALQAVGPYGAAARVMMERAKNAAGGQVSGKHLLLTFTARLARVSAFYERMAYSLIAKEVGCLFQTLYLVAEGLGLGACALGIGRYEAIGTIAGLEPLTEPQVGELLVGNPG